MLRDDGCPNGGRRGVYRPGVQDRREPPPLAPRSVRGPSVGPAGGRMTDQIEHDDGALPDRLPVVLLMDGDGLHECAVAPVEPAYRLAQGLDRSFRHVA